VATAVAAAGYAVGAPSWLSRDPRTWITAAAGAVLAVAVALIAEATGLMRLTSGVGGPDEGGLMVAALLGLAAGVSTCMALTGGLVLALSATYTAGRSNEGREERLAGRLRPHAAFQAGRIGGFAVLGAALGAAGAGVALPAPVVALLMVTAAVVMGSIGIRLTGLSPRVAAWSPTLPPGLSRALGLGRDLPTSYSDARGLALGAATFFLPCGFTQAVQIYALSTGSPFEAGAVMALFAVGTAPGLLALGGLPEVVPARRRAGLLQVVGVVVLGFALVNGTAGLRLAGLVPAAGGGGTTAGASVVDEGTQTLRTTQVADGYLPAEATLLAGMPTRWTIDSVDAFTCAVFLEVPSLGISVTLEEGENVIELPPLQPGRVPFMCSMGMYVGHLDVVEPPGAAAR
jgi:uncharacterized protein